MPVEFPGALLYRKTANVESLSRTSEFPVLPSLEPYKATFLVDAEIAAATQSDPSEAPAVPLPPARPLLVEGCEASARMARSCADQGNLDEALEWCEKAIVTDKLDPAHHYLLATILQEQGQYEIAAQSLGRVLYLEPRFVLAHFSLGNLHQSQGHYREAQRHFENVLLLLRTHLPEEILPEADGLTAGRLAEIVASLLEILPQDTVVSA